MKIEVLGKDHMSVADGLFKLGRLYHVQCEYGKAENLFLGVLDISLKYHSKYYRK